MKRGTLGEKQDDTVGAFGDNFLAFPDQAPILRARLEITSLSCSLPRSSVGVYDRDAPASQRGRRSVSGCVPTQEHGNVQIGK